MEEIVHQVNSIIRIIHNSPRSAGSKAFAGGYMGTYCIPSPGRIGWPVTVGRFYEQPTAVTRQRQNGVKSAIIISKLLTPLGNPEAFAKGTNMITVTETVTG